MDTPLERPVQVSVVLVAAGLPRHVESADGRVEVVDHGVVHADGPVGVGAVEERVGVPVRDQDVLGPGRRIAVPEGESVLGAKFYNHGEGPFS